MVNILMLLRNQSLQQCIYINRIDINRSPQGSTKRRKYMATNSMAISRDAEATSFAQGAVVVLGRLFFVLIFLMSGPLHFSKQEVAYTAAQGVPLPAILVPFSGLLAVAGGLSILLGYRAKIGAWLLVIFLVPVTVMMHNFWSVSDPMTLQIERAMFMKNVTMLGGALVISY